MANRNSVESGDARAISPLSCLCSGAIEASWLTAVAVVPSLFNPYTEFSFGPEKATLLHGLAVLIAGAWLLRLVLERRQGGIESGWPNARSFWHDPVALALLAFVIARVVGTCISVEPGQSLWGDYQTRAGFYTFASYVVLFAATAANLRTNEQLERFVSAVLAGSVPVSLYALVQRLHFDPINWGAVEPMRSLVGHPLFLAAYLGMVFPLCLWQIIRLLGLFRPQSGASTNVGNSSTKSVPRLRGIALAFYIALAILQLLVFVLTQKRGPLLGLLSAVVCFFVLVSVSLKLLRLLLGTVLAASLALLFLVLLNIPGGPLEGLRSSRVLDRFSHGLFSGREGTGFFRADLWKECPNLMLSQQPILLPGGAKDKLHPVRPWFGYGPETTSGVLAQHYTAPHTNATFEDRFHNLVWDLWESVGAFGLLAFFALFAALYSCGLRQLNLIRTRRDLLVFVAVLCLFCFGGTTALAFFQGRGFGGLGLQVGLATGCIAYPLVKLGAAQRSGKSESGGGQPESLSISDSTLLVIALLSALTMHLVETGFAFPTASTGTLFWTFAGLLVASQRWLAQSPRSDADAFLLAQPTSTVEPVRSAAPSGSKAQARSPKQDKGTNARLRSRTASAQPRSISQLFQSAWWPACLTTMFLIPLLNLFLLRYSRNGLAALDFIAHALDPAGSAHASRSVVPELLLAVWLGSTFLLLVPSFLSAPGPGWAVRYFAALALSGGATAIYALWCAGRLALIGPIPTGGAEAWNLLEQARGYESLFWWSMTLLLVLVLLGAVACAGLPPGRLRSPAIAGLLAGLAILVIVFTIAVDLAPVRASISARWADILQSQKVWPASQQVFERAIQLQPDQFVYRSKLAKALREQGEAARDEATLSRLFKQAEETLQATKILPAYNRRAWHLGQLYLAWAHRTANSDRRLELARKAKASFEEALLWEPKNAPLWSDYGVVDLNLLHDEQAGVLHNQKAIDIDPTFEQALGRFADFYSQKSADASDSDNKRIYARKAESYYRQAAENSSAPFAYQIARGAILMNLQEWTLAVQQFTEACDSAGEDHAAHAQEMLARAYLGARNRAAALEHVRQAIGQAAPQEKPALLEFEKQLTNEH